MPKYQVFLDCDYVVGHLRYGHLEGVVVAASEEQAKEMVSNDTSALDLKIDDYEVDDYDVDWNSLEVKEVK